MMCQFYPREVYQKHKSVLPKAYVDFIEASDGWEGFLAGDGDYVILWSKELIQEYYEDCVMEKYLDPRWFAFGSNGGGEMLCFDIGSRDEGVYWLPFIGMSDEQPI